MSHPSPPRRSDRWRLRWHQSAIPTTTIRAAPGTRLDVHGTVCSTADRAAGRASTRRGRFRCGVSPERSPAAHRRAAACRDHPTERCFPNDPGVDPRAVKPCRNCPVRCRTPDHVHPACATSAVGQPERVTRTIQSTCAVSDSRFDADFAMSVMASRVVPTARRRARSGRITAAR